MIETPTHVILWRKPCGCVVVISGYHYNWRNEEASQSAQYIRNGLLPETITWAEYKRQPYKYDVFAPCPHGQAAFDAAGLPMFETPAP